MTRERTGAGIGLKVASAIVIAFLYFPLAIIVLYAFTTQSSSFTFPPPGFTLEWFSVAFGAKTCGRPSAFAARRLDRAPLVAIMLGSLLAGAVHRSPILRS